MLKKKEEILGEYILKRKSKIFVGDAKENDIVLKYKGISDCHCAILNDNKYYLLGIYGKFTGKKYSVKNTDTFIGREQFSSEGIENDIILADDMPVSKKTCKNHLTEKIT
ncbi:MAG: FHA domain-containing protein [Endomicrobium sp.]|nr:FHA domain-containing protein [Endomicrobium sp.]